jgi:hypothetical protein
MQLKNKHMKYLIVIIAIGIGSCTYNRGETGISEVMGYEPVYAPAATAQQIELEQPRPTVNPGKIYAYGNYLFQIEENEGIHIIENGTPSQAQKSGFIRIAGASELAIKSNYLYTNHLDDIVVLNLSTSTPGVVHRLENAFPQISQDYPPVAQAYFECPDPSKGIVIGWKEKIIREPKCRR